jgi:4-hydroxybenzoate polyprenyltransferase
VQTCARAPFHEVSVFPVSYIAMLRPLQWLKNLMIFFPPFLGGALFLPGMAMR